jgi:hypothetical protein
MNPIFFKNGFYSPSTNLQATSAFRNARIISLVDWIGIIDVKRNSIGKSIVLHVIQFSRTELNVPIRNGAYKIQ